MTCPVKFGPNSHWVATGGLGPKVLDCLNLSLARKLPIPYEASAFHSYRLEEQGNWWLLKQSVRQAGGLELILDRPSRLRCFCRQDLQLETFGSLIGEHTARLFARPDGREQRRFHKALRRS